MSFYPPVFHATLFLYGRFESNCINLKLYLEKYLPDNSQGNVLTCKNLSVYYKLMKLYDAEVRIEKYIYITEKKSKIDGYTIFIIYYK